MENEQGQFNDDGRECIHHWLLDERNFGICKKCAASKQFCSSWGTIQRARYVRLSKVQHDVPGTNS